MTGGGGVSQLNFSVVGNPQPTNPSDNIIWVDTASITDWVISSVAPSSPVANMVWIEVDDSSTVSFNALKEHSLMLRPVAVWQYSSSAWNKKNAQISKDGAFTQFSYAALYMYLLGSTYNSITGGYTGAGLKAGSGASGVGAPSINNNGTSLVINAAKSSSSSTYVGGIARTVNKISCNSYNTLRFKGKASGSCTFSVWSDIGANQSVNRVKSTPIASGATSAYIDVSGLSGSYYIGFGFDSKNSQITLTVDSLYLE
jgi:hypothetical protein